MRVRVSSKVLQSLDARLRHTLKFQRNSNTQSARAVLLELHRDFACVRKKNKEREERRTPEEVGGRTRRGKETGGSSQPELISCPIKISPKLPPPSRFMVRNRCATMFVAEGGGVAILDVSYSAAPAEHYELRIATILKSEILLNPIGSSIDIYVRV